MESTLPALNKYITRGLVVTTPNSFITEENKWFSTFRLAANTSEFNDNINWFTVTLSGPLAEKFHTEVKKGDRLLVIGAIKVRDWDNGERSGTTIEIEVEEYQKERRP